MDTLKQDIKTYTKRLKKAINKSRKNLAKEALFTVIAESPVWAGLYVESMRVGINTIDSSHLTPHYGTPYLPKLNEGHALALKTGVFSDLEPLIEASKFEDKIFISNSIPYADQVEYGTLKRTAHHPFGKTALKVKAKMYLALKGTPI